MPEQPRSERRPDIVLYLNGPVVVVTGVSWDLGRRRWPPISPVGTARRHAGLGGKRAGQNAENPVVGGLRDVET